MLPRFDELSPLLGNRYLGAALRSLEENSNDMAEKEVRQRHATRLASHASRSQVAHVPTVAAALSATHEWLKEHGDAGMAVSLRSTLFELFLMIQELKEMAQLRRELEMHLSKKKRDQVKVAATREKPHASRSLTQIDAFKDRLLKQREAFKANRLAYLPEMQERHQKCLMDTFKLMVRDA